MKRLICAVILASLLLTGCGPQTAAPQAKKYTATFLDVFDTVTTVVGMAENEEAFTEQARQVPQKPAAARVLPVSGGGLSADKILAQEPGRIQAAYQSLPKVAQRAIVKKGRM